jgi:cell filamentation protein
MNEFNANVLSRLPDNYNNDEKLIRDIAVVHGELLFIHPFREGNGRRARILANLMARKQGFDALEFGKIKEAQHAIYISAIQHCASKDYGRIIELIQSIFPK